jgi:hypothetical protein
MAACANPFADDVPEVSREPLPGLAERPSGQVEAPAEATATAPTRDATDVTTSNGTPATGTGPTTTTTTSADRAAPSTEPGSARPRMRTLQVDDPAGDAGVGAPKYADGILLTIEDLGDGARVTVRLAAALPAELADQEVIGIGVDFFRSNSSESDYQLFADGGSDGWRAFLQTPEGFVRYPGAFRLTGDQLQFEVPWSSLGGAPTGSVRTFVDWGKPTLAGIVTRTQDLLPDRSTAAIQPA